MLKRESILENITKFQRNLPEYLERKINSIDTLEEEENSNVKFGFKVSISECRFIMYLVYYKNEQNLYFIEQDEQWVLSLQGDNEVKELSKEASIFDVTKRINEYLNKS